jgi:hypothetical protein
MAPSEVLERFSEQEVVDMVAYQNLYGPVGPKRLDFLFARLGMDVAAPNMKKGTTPKLKDHLVEWNRKTRIRKTGREMLNMVKKEYGNGDS